MKRQSKREQEKEKEINKAFWLVLFVILIIGFLNWYFDIPAELPK